MGGMVKSLLIIISFLFYFFFMSISLRFSIGGPLKHLPRQTFTKPEIK